MPCTPPSHRSPATSALDSRALGRCGAHQSGQTSEPLFSCRAEFPQPTAYLTQHLRIPLVRSAACAPTPKNPPPSTVYNEKNDTSGLSANCSFLQSPPVTDDLKVPTGATTSPPDSGQNSTENEETNISRGRKLEIVEHRESSPNRTTAEIEKTVQLLQLFIPSKDAQKPVDPLESTQVLRKIAHNRSNTHSPVVPCSHNDLSTETPLVGPDEDYRDAPERSWRKRPLLRKKSGELVRSAVRPPSARRWTSSMPSTPTFSKTVHFDSHLEDVRHFLQFDRPWAVSAGSSPVEAYDSDTEFTLGKEDSSNVRSPPYDWELVASKFPAKPPQRLLPSVRVEKVFLSADNEMLIGSVAVADLAFHKIVIARFTLDHWTTTSEVVAEYNDGVHQQKNTDGYDRFNFNLKLADQANLEAKTMFFCVKYFVNGKEYWDNNNSANFQIHFRKNYKPQNGIKCMQETGSRPVHHLLSRNHKYSSPISAGHPSPDDFANGLDPRYKFVDSKESTDFLAEPYHSFRLQGSQSVIHLGPENLTRRVGPNGRAFGNRYDFSVSLSAATQAIDTSLGDFSGIYMTSSSKKQNKIISNAPITESNVSASPVNANKETFAANKSVPMAAATSSASCVDSPRSARIERQFLASQSYNELLKKNCFARSR